MRYRGLLPVAAVCLALVSCKSQKTSTPVTNGEVPDELKELYYEAENAFQAGNDNEARILFEKYTKKSPKPAPGFYRLACLDLRKEDKINAFQNIAKAKQADTNNYYYDLFEADLHKKIRQYSDAAKIYSRLATRYPSHWSFFEDAAKMYRNAGENEQLILHCDRWEKAFGLREEIVQMRSEARITLKHYNAAILDWENLIKKYPYRRQYKLNYAAVLSRAGKYDRAAAVYSELVAADPENPELLASLCQYYQEHGTREALWKHCLLVVKSQQMDVWKKHSCLVPFLNNIQGNTYYDSLEAPLKTLTVIHASDHRSWLFLADWYYAKKLYLQAMDGFSRTLQLFSNDFQVWSKYTECLDRTANHQRMMSVTDSMLEVFPSNPSVYLMAATASIGAKDWKKGNQYANDGLAYAVDEDLVVPLKISLARILNFSGKKDEAYAALEALDKQYPGNATLLAELAYSHAYNNEDLANSVKWIDKAMELSPNNARLLYTKGFVESKNRNYSDALKALNEAVSLDASGKIYELLGDVNYLSNNHEAAIENWQKAWSTGYHTAELEKKKISGKLSN